MTWTDIHSHILPGFDDGASSEQEFLEMARKAVEGGTSVMVATPHYDHESPAFELPEITEAVVSHNSLLQERNIPLRLVPGAEVRVNAGLRNVSTTLRHLPSKFKEVPPPSFRSRATVSAN